MYEDLATLYSQQARFKDLFALRIRLRQLDEALNLWLETRALGFDCTKPEDKILELLDYVCAGQIMRATLERTTEKLFDNTKYLLFPDLERRVGQWEHIYQVCHQGVKNENYVTLRGLEITPFLCLYVSHGSSQQD